MRARLGFPRRVTLRRPDGKLAWPSGSFWTGLGALGVLGLLTYPLPTAWLGLGAFLIATVARRRMSGRLPSSTPLALPLGLYLGGAAVGLYVTTTPVSAGVHLFGLIAALATFSLITDSVGSGQAAYRLLRGMLLAVLVATPLLASVVLYSLQPLDFGQLPAPPADLLASSRSLHKAVRDFYPDRDDDVEGRYRLTGGGLSSLAAFGAALALGPLLAGPSRRERLLGGLASGYFALFLLLAGRRWGLVSVLAVAALFLALRYRWLLVVGLGLAAAAIVVVSRVGLTESTQRLGFGALGSVSDLTSGQQRLEHWGNLLYLLGDFRFTGVGLGADSYFALYKEFYAIHKQFWPTEYYVKVLHAHNMFLQTYLEQGLLGLLGLLGVIAVGLVVGYRTLRQVRDPWLRVATISGGGAALTFVLTGLLEITPVTTLGSVMLFGSLGLVFAVSRLEGRPAGRFVPHWPYSIKLPTRRGASLIAGTVAFLVLLVVLATATASRVEAIPSLQQDASRLSQPLVAATAALNLNLGALELTRVTGTNSVPRREREQRLALAESFLQRALALDPENVGIHRNLATLALARGQSPEALRVLAEATRLADPGDRRYLIQLGRLYRDAGSAELALDAWSRARAKAQLAGWGAYLEEHERGRGAVDAYRAAIRIDPTDGTLYPALARALVRTAGRDAALAEMQELAQLYPELGWAYLEVGDHYWRAGQLEQARAWYEQGAAVGPDQPGARDAQMRIER